MMSNHTQSPADRELTERLREAIDALRIFVPNTVWKLMTSNEECFTRCDVFNWRDRIAASVLELAEPLAEQPGYFGIRTNCPLCGAGSSQPYVKGFAFPNGLRMHLCGERNAHECTLMRVFKNKALADIENEFLMSLRRRNFGKR